MVAPAQNQGREILPEAELPVRVVGTSFEMRTPIEQITIPVREEITQVIVARRDETKQGSAERGTSYERPLPPMEGDTSMAHDDHGKKSDGGSKASEPIGNTALKLVGAGIALLIAWSIFVGPINKNSNSGGGNQPNVVYVTPAPAVVAAPVVAYPTRPTPSVQFAQPQRHYRTRTTIIRALCDDGNPPARDGRCHNVTVTWHPGNPTRR